MVPAKPTTEELAAAPHHFIGHLSIAEEYSMGAYERDALDKLEKLFQKKDILILVGGSGLYLNALCQGIDEFPEVPTEIRNEVEDFYQHQGLAALQSAVQQADPDYFAEADQQNPHRLIRALAVCRASGRPFSDFRKKKSKERTFTPVYIQMHWDRQKLYDRINLRVDQMMEQGLLEEVRQLLPYRQHTALQTVGYRELFGFLDNHTNYETAVELIKRNSRRYAKRQLTWMRRDGFWKRFHPKEWESALNYIHTAINNDWQWKVPTDSSANKLSTPSSGKNMERFLTLLQKGEQIAALRMRSFKRFELLEQAQFKPDLPANMIQYFLHEAVSRCEEAQIYAILPPSCLDLLTAQGFSTPAFDQIPEAITKAMEISNNKDILSWRKALS